VKEFLRGIGDYRRPGSLAARARQRRHALLRSLLDPLPRPLRIVDLGGTEAFWEHSGLLRDPGLEIVLVNQTAPAPRAAALRGASADLRKPLAFADREFDVVFSNSVIEHLGSRESQETMARECARIGRRYFVQTPNRFFPIEPHFLLPWFPLYPLRLQTELVRRFDLGWYRRKPDPAEAEAFVRSFRLLSLREMRALFPGARILRERFLGLTKSFVACRGWPEPPR
jgi:hypothetical protein